LIFGLNHLQDQFDLSRLLIRQLPKSPNDPLAYAFAVPVGFSDGVRLICSSLICGGTVAQVHDISSSSSVTTLPFKNAFVNPFLWLFLGIRQLFGYFFCDYTIARSCANPLKIGILSKPFRNRGCMASY
jgi:hypothetical protein